MFCSIASCPLVAGPTSLGLCLTAGVLATLSRPHCLAALALPAFTLCRMRLFRRTLAHPLWRMARSGALLRGRGSLVCLSYSPCRGGIPGSGGCQGTRLARAGKAHAKGLPV